MRLRLEGQQGRQPANGIADCLTGLAIAGRSADRAAKRSAKASDEVPEHPLRRHLRLLLLHLRAGLERQVLLREVAEILARLLAILVRKLPGISAHRPAMTAEEVAYRALRSELLLLRTGLERREGTEETTRSLADRSAKISVPADVIAEILPAEPANNLPKRLPACTLRCELLLLLLLGWPGLKRREGAEEPAGGLTKRAPDIPIASETIPDILAP